MFGTNTSSIHLEKTAKDEIVLLGGAIVGCE